MARLLGLETEYGLHIEDADPGRMVEESRALVQAYDGPYLSPWDYSAEDPRRDMRGFTVANLVRDPADARYDAGGTACASISDEHADRVLPNGGRLYNDHGHPEFSTPECTSLRELVAYDRAGAGIVLACARRRAEVLGQQVVVYKNNTDFHGASYGTHECYLVRRDTPVEKLIEGLASFLATRQVFAGSGKTAFEGDHQEWGRFQISQRADFIAVEASVDTLHRRPLFNTRDEPHATADRYRRLHVICGDANMSDWATALKVGTLSLVLDAIEQGVPMPCTLQDPVSAVRDVSRDPSLRARLRRRDGTMLTAIEVQRRYLDAAAGADSDWPDRQWVLDEWSAVLDDLERDWANAADRVDWCAKRRMVEDFIRDEKLDWSSPIVQSLDLAYHDVDPETGLQRELESEGLMRRLVSEADVEAAMIRPPENTRAYVRGHFASRHAESVLSVGWSSLAFTDGEADYVFDMEPLVNGGLRRLNRALGRCRSLSETIEALRRYRADSRQVVSQQRSKT
jgi:proteasome accessory factor A